MFWTTYTKRRRIFFFRTELNLSQTNFIQANPSKKGAKIDVSKQKTPKISLSQATLSKIPSRSKIAIKTPNIINHTSPSYPQTNPKQAPSNSHLRSKIQNIGKSEKWCSEKAREGLTPSKPQSKFTPSQVNSSSLKSTTTATLRKFGSLMWLWGKGVSIQAVITEQIWCFKCQGMIIEIVWNLTTSLRKPLLEQSIYWYTVSVGHHRWTPSIFESKI